MICLSDFPGPRPSPITDHCELRSLESKCGHANENDNDIQILNHDNQMKEKQASEPNKNNQNKNKQLQGNAQTHETTLQRGKTCEMI